MSDQPHDHHDSEIPLTSWSGLGERTSDTPGSPSTRGSEGEEALASSPSSSTSNFDPSCVDTAIGRKWLSRSSTRTSRPKGVATFDRPQEAKTRYTARADLYGFEGAGLADLFARAARGHDVPLDAFEDAAASRLTELTVIAAVSERDRDETETLHDRHKLPGDDYPTNEQLQAYELWHARSENDRLTPAPVVAETLGVSPRDARRKMGPKPKPKLVPLSRPSTRKPGRPTRADSALKKQRVVETEEMLPGASIRIKAKLADVDRKTYAKFKRELEAEEMSALAEIARDVKEIKQILKDSKSAATEPVAPRPDLKMSEGGKQS